MAEAFIVAGTDTGVGKTVVSAMLTLALDGVYWKPVQSGLEEETDTDAARRMTGLPSERFLPEAYRLGRPLSPHAAAEIDGVTIEPARLALPACERPLIVEPAGGLLVPLAPGLLQADVIAGWGAPVILCARTTLGTINHSLLSLEALRRRNVAVAGVAFVGEARPDTEATIARLGGVRYLGRVPPLETIDAVSLRRVFEAGFRREDFAAGVPA